MSDKVRAISVAQRTEQWHCGKDTRDAFGVYARTIPAGMRMPPQGE